MFQNANAGPEGPASNNNNTTATVDASIVVDFTALLLDTLGFTEHEFVSIGHDADGQFHTAVGTPAGADNFVSELPDGANVYFGVNPVRGPARQGKGRGTAEDVTRLAALYADIDVKPGACPSLDVAHAIVANLGIILGTRPSVIVNSGGGLHPYWPVTEGTPSAALLRRWGRLVAVVAENLNVKVDTVYDLARMLRVPGTFNNKTSGQAAPVSAHADAGGPLTLAEIDERLNEHGIYQEDGDDQQHEQISNPAGWTFADRACNYVGALIDGLSDDGPLTGKGRHQWVLKQTVRLACAVRLGCISENDWRRAQKLLDERLNQLRAATGQKVPRHEVPAAMRFGIERAATKTDEQARAELGDHEHSADSDKLVEDGDDDVKHSGHLGMAIKLGQQFDGKLLYVNGIGWHRWDGKRWAPDGDGAARRAVHAVIKRDRRIIKRLDLSAEEEDKALKAVARYETASAITGILTEAAALQVFSVTVSDIDADPFLLNAADGTLDLHTMEVRPASPADRITKVCRGAYHRGAQGAVWNAFLEKVLPDEGVRGFVQRLTGLALLGEVREHILPIFTGTGANGKGTFYKAVLYVLDDYACAAEADLFTHRENAHPTGQMDLMGRRFVVVSETDEGRRLAEATMKRLTGGDPVTARYMRENFVTFTPSHLPILVTNHLPKVSGDDPAIWRRIRVVPFDVVIADDEQDGTLDAKLQLEADAVLSWAVDGLRDYLVGGLAEPDSVVSATARYKTSSHSVARFIEEVCHPAGKISAGELFDAWDRWRRLDGTEETSKHAFGKALGRLGYQSSDSNGKRWWHGICILAKGEQ